MCEPLTFAYWVHVHAPMRLSPLNFLGRTSRAPVTSWCSGTLVKDLEHHDVAHFVWSRYGASLAQLALPESASAVHVYEVALRCEPHIGLHAEGSGAVALSL